MSFTADELQALNDILEQKLQKYHRDLEHSLDQQLASLRHAFHQRLDATQQEIIRSVTQKLAEHEQRLNLALAEKLTAQQLTLLQLLSQEIRHKLTQSPQHGHPYASLADQLQAIQQRLDQGLVQTVILSDEQLSQIEAIELQTDIAWEDLAPIFDSALEHRLTSLQQALQSTINEWGRALTSQLQPPPRHANLQSMEEVFQSIEQLERLIESMQVAMTANAALLSNRLYQHQQLTDNHTHSRQSPTETQAHQPDP